MGEHVDLLLGGSIPDLIHPAWINDEASLAFFLLLLMHELEVFDSIIENTFGHSDSDVALLEVGLRKHVAQTVHQPPGIHINVLVELQISVPVLLLFLKYAPCRDLNVVIEADQCLVGLLYAHGRYYAQKG